MGIMCCNRQDFIEEERCLYSRNIFHNTILLNVAIFPDVFVRGKS